ncbi:MAG: pseudouridine synthase [Planctomycetota bacterium]
MPKRQRPSDRSQGDELDASQSAEHRINKVLASAGLGSRRQVDELIEQGRVEIDGKVIQQVGVKVDPDSAEITVDGEPLKRHRPVYFALHKPEGVLCTNRDPQGRPRVVDMVPNSARLFPVGRLDAASTGLILLTNDGELAQRLTHPKHGVPKRYAVVVVGQVELDSLKRLQKGIYLAEGRAKVDHAKIKRLRKGCTEIEITLSEGKNREIRRVLARLGHKVVSLKRIAIGPLKLGDMPDGAYRPLSNQEVSALNAAVEELRRARKEERKARKKRLPEPVDESIEVPAETSRPRKPRSGSLPSLAKNPFAMEEDFETDSFDDGEAILIRDHDLSEDDEWIEPSRKRFGQVIADDDLDDEDDGDEAGAIDGRFLETGDLDDTDEDGEDGDEESEDGAERLQVDPDVRRIHKRLGKKPKLARGASGKAQSGLGRRSAGDEKTTRRPSQGTQRARAEGGSNNLNGATDAPRRKTQRSSRKTAGRQGDRQGIGRERTDSPQGEFSGSDRPRPIGKSDRPRVSKSGKRAPSSKGRRGSSRPSAGRPSAGRPSTSGRSAGKRGPGKRGTDRKPRDR